MDDELELPKWMKQYGDALKVVRKKNDADKIRPKEGSSAELNNLTVSSTSAPNKRAPSSVDINYLPAVKKSRHDGISSRLLLCDVAIECEKLLNSAGTSDGPLILGLDLNWPVYSFLVGKSSRIHVCYGENRCLFFEVDGLRKLPLVFIKLISHPNVKLIGRNIIQDLFSLGKDYNFNAKPIISSNLVLSSGIKQILSCEHNWSYRLIDDSLSQLDGQSQSSVECDRVARFKGKIKYCTRFEECAAFSEELLARVEHTDRLVLGFDIEWPVYFKRGSGRVALLQICPDEDVCFIFRVFALRFLPKVLVILLNHSKVRLTGLNIANDLRKLGRDFNVDLSLALSNLIELSSFANETLLCQERWSLAGLVANQLQVDLEKGPVRTSNWANENLTDEQLMYAATDAYVSLLCYLKLKSYGND